MIMRKCLAIFIVVVSVLLLSGTVSALSVTVSDTTPTIVAPMENYSAYNITITLGTIASATLEWLNVTINKTVPNPASLSNIKNISVIINTTGQNIVNYALRSSNGSWICLNLSATPISNTTPNILTVYILLNNTGLVDGSELALNGTLVMNVTRSSGGNITNDPAPEIINVLNATLNITDEYAAQNQDNIVVANLAITPGNNSVSTHLDAVTFNITSITNLSPNSIKSFTLWNDTNGNGKLDPSDQPIATEPGGKFNVSFTNLSSNPQSLIPAGAVNHHFFLTINVSGAKVGARYQLQIFAQNIVIDQGTGDSDTKVSPTYLTIMKAEEDTTPVTLIAPGETVTAFNVTYYERTSDTDGSTIQSISIDWNKSAINLAEPSNIMNITILNATTGALLNYTGPISSFPITLPLNVVVPDNSSYKIMICVTASTSGLIDGKNISLNVTIRDNESEVLYASDPYPETINVLDAQVHPTLAHASEGQKFVVVANVTVDPANDTVNTYLRSITFKVTPITTLTKNYIESYILWNDTNGNGKLDINQDTPLEKIVSPSGVNVTFTVNSLIPAGHVNRYFLTLNLSSDIPQNQIHYQVEIPAQGIVISQGSGDSKDLKFQILSITTVRDSPITYVHPGETYLAYNITYAENMNDATGEQLRWLNVTGMSAGTIKDIVNVTVRNATDGTLLGYNNSFVSFPISVKLNAIVPNNGTYKLAVYVTASPSVRDGTRIALNAELKTNETYKALVVNDPSPEIVSITGIRIIAPSKIYAGWSDITVKVVDPAGNPLSGCRVTLSGCGIKPITKITNKNGIALFKIFTMYGGTIKILATYTNVAGEKLTKTTYITVLPLSTSGGGQFINYIQTPTTTPKQLSTPRPTLVPTTAPTPTHKLTPIPTPTPTPTLTPTPKPTPTPTKKSPGFEAIFAIAGLISTTYMLRRLL